MGIDTAFDIVLHEFLKISEIPRPSHHEEQIAQYLAKWATDHGLQVELDTLGQVIIDKPASVGCEAAPCVIFQAHMDMVCIAAEGVQYNPLTDAIRVINDGVNLTADGTSLGADDGIGIAMCLYLLQDTALRHGPIRAIFTVNEEDGMASMDMDAKYLDGCYLINLDWETIGSLCNSCAGGDYFNFSQKPEWEAAPAEFKTIKVELRNLLGGHSGVGINKGHANALVTMATALRLLRSGNVAFRLSSFAGGQAKNAIPAQSTAVLAVDSKDCAKAEKLLQQFHSEFMDAFAAIEKDVVWTVQQEETPPPRVLGREVGYRLIDLMTTVPNNVHTMSPFIDGLVESSSNLGVISLGEELVSFTVFARSSVGYQATQISAICKALADCYNFQLDAEGHVPGWAVNPTSTLTEIACEAYKTLTGEEMIVEPVHAGVECGAFSGKNPKLDMIAIGPTLMDVHSPAESCCLKDVETVTALLVAILEKIVTITEQG